MAARAVPAPLGADEAHGEADVCPMSDRKETEQRFGSADR